MTNFKMTIRTDCAVSTCNSPLACVNESSCLLIVSEGESTFGQESTLPLCKVLWRTSRQKHAQEKLPLAQGQGQWPRGATARPRSGAAAENARLRWHRSAREELPNGRGQEWRPRGATPCPRSGGCAGAGGPRGATPRSRSGGAAVRSYPSSKVYSVIQFKVKGPVPCMHLEPEGYSLH